jgi:hypothetical protein
MLSDSGSTNSDSKLPIFPQEREKFEDWKMKMLAYLDSRGLLRVVQVPSPILPSKSMLAEDKMAAWYKDCDDKTEKADALLRSATSETNMEAALKDPSVIFKLGIKKCKRAYDILLSSLHSKQMSIINTIFPSNAYEVWQAINSSYSVVNTSRNKMMNE